MPQSFVNKKYFPQNSRDYCCFYFLLNTFPRTMFFYLVMLSLHLLISRTHVFSCPTNNTPAFLCGAWPYSPCCWPQWSQPQEGLQRHVPGGLYCLLVHSLWAGVGLSWLCRGEPGYHRNVQGTTSPLANTVPGKNTGYSPGKEALNCASTAHKALGLKS